MRMIMGLDRPTSGTVTVNGKPYRQHRAPLREVGALLEASAVHLLAYFDTDRSSNGGTEGINGLIELHRRIARGFRNLKNYRLRMLLIGGGLADPRLP
jgi:transposase